VSIRGALRFLCFRFLHYSGSLRADTAILGQFRFRAPAYDLNNQGAI
jgi:hypothetical protein